MSCYNTYETTLLNKLPDEILDYIWSMNHKWAANILQKNVRVFIKTKVCEIKNMIDFACWPCDLGGEMKNYNLFYRNKVLKSTDVLNTFAACKCCTRHQINKPKVLEKWQEIEVTRYTQEIGCPCACRHLSRWLCRGIE